MMIKASYFDGMSAWAHPVELRSDEDQLALDGATVTRRYRRSACRMAEPFAAAPGIVEFNDGSHCEVPASEGAALAALMRHAPSRVERWQSRWPAAMAAVAAMVGMIGLGYFQGIPALTQLVVERMPFAAEQRLGDVAQQEFEDKVLEPSNFSDQRLAELEDVFQNVQPVSSRVPLRLLVRHAPQVGPNAFALPNGTIVVTDDLVRLFIGKGEVADAQDELEAIFAHEIAHIELRHSIRGLTQSSLTLAGSWFLFGDFSAVAAGLPALVSRLSYSRDMEHEADAFAGAALRRIGHSPAVLADALTILQEGSEDDTEAQEELPEWMRTHFGFLSTHPGTRERVARLNAQTAEQQ